MMKLNEDAIEQMFIGWLKQQGYTYYHDSTINPQSDNPQRDAFDSVLLEKELKASLKKINPDLPESARVEAFQQLLNLGLNDIMECNEKFHTLLTDGVTVEYFNGGETVGLHVKLFDFETPANNSFWVVNQFKVHQENQRKRLDVVLFINGLPLVVVELKNPIRKKATLENAYTQIQNYKDAIPTIFFYNALCIISDGLEARVSSVSAPFSRFLPWKSPVKEENGKLTELQIMTEQMLKPEVLLRLIRFNTVFEPEEVKDEKTGLLSVVKVKKVAAYHQYYVVEKAVRQTIRATAEGGDKKVGVVWHTQGSGKSLSMLFYAGQLVVERAMMNPTLIILTDRNDLDDQLFSTFSNCKALLRQEPVQAESREHLKKLLTVTGGGIVFTTIQKFSTEENEECFDELSARRNIVVIADEAHRSQYGFKGKLNNKGETRYGNAKYLRDAFPNASFIGFTGTPIEKEDRDTRRVFGDYIDTYDIAQAVKDGATVPLSYESRLVKIKLNEGIIDKIDPLIENIEGATEEQLEKSKKRNAQINAIIGHPERLKDIAKDIVTHFEKRQKVFEGKGMIVCMTRQIAVDLYQQIILLKPEWHSDDLMKGSLKVVMTSSSDDPQSFQPHNTNKNDRKLLATRFKESNDPFKLVIVQGMWLTGFDAPPLHTLYLDNRLKGAALMQAIARVNRVYKDKPGGLIVDYIGIGQDLRIAMQIYVESGGEGEVAPDIKEIISAMNAKLEVVQQMFHPFKYQKFFRAKTEEKLKILLAAQNFIVADEKLKDRFITEVTKLSKLYVMAVPSDESEKIKEEIAFFQAIKSRLSKFTPKGGKTDAQVESAIRQIVDDALKSDGVIDIFEAAGLSSPSLDILSEEFLLEVQNMEHKNLAFELLKKLLSDEVKRKTKKNMVLGKKFSKMLEDRIEEYHNHQIDTTQVIQKLVDMSREMKLEENKARDLGLTDEEYAFYSILSKNSSTAFLEDAKMKELIHLIVTIIRKNTSIDWNKRQDVKAKLRLLVKKVLMKYGYPPDLARMEADKVLEQSDLLAAELSS